MKIQTILKPGDSVSDFIEVREQPMVIQVVGLVKNIRYNSIGCISLWRRDIDSPEFYDASPNHEVPNKIFLSDVADYRIIIEMYNAADPPCRAIAFKARSCDFPNRKKSYLIEEGLMYPTCFGASNETL